MFFKPLIRVTLLVKKRMRGLPMLRFVVLVALSLAAAACSGTAQQPSLAEAAPPASAILTPEAFAEAVKQASLVGADMTVIPSKALLSPAAPESNSCTAPAAGACGGCSISCPSNKAAYCASGLTDWRPMNGGGAPICVRQAACYCS